jgi:hypothetical protein
VLRPAMIPISVLKLLIFRRYFTWRGADDTARVLPERKRRAMKRERERSG